MIRGPLLEAVLGLLLLILPLTSSIAEPLNQATITLDGVLLDADLPRYGLNLGGSGTWGAEHLRANLLNNPGFEPVLDRTLLVVKQVYAKTIVDDTSWLARADGFWNGAEFVVISGKLAGTTGKVTESYKRHVDGLGEFVTDVDLNGLDRGDIVSVMRRKDEQAAPQWWRGRGLMRNDSDTPVTSRGQQSLRLLADKNNPVEILHYFDNITDRAGKLILVNGQWSFRIWAKTSKPGSLLHLYFGRSGSQPFLQRDITPTREWKHYQLDFNASDSGPAGVLTLSIIADGGEILLDDAYLGEANPGVGGFRQAVVKTLMTIKPGYLRDWQGQLGDTLHNRIAGEYDHQPVRYRPGDNEIQFHYGLTDFFELCAAVGARPWVVAPSTMSANEWRDFGVFLRQSADRYHFDEILVEFGNENWNQIFRPGGIPDAAIHAEVADRDFHLMKLGSGSDKRIRTIVNAQYVNPESPRTMARLSREADLVAVAPYMLNTLDAGKTNQQAHHAAFEESGELLQQESEDARSRNKRLAVYEVNFHSTWGGAELKQRNAVVTGAASGVALARRLMQGSVAGVREQNVYLLGGFDSFAGKNNDLVRLWGVTRDLTIPNNFRPTGLALAMLNSVAGGRTVGIRCIGESCSGLTALAFYGGTRMAVASARNEETKLTVQMICPDGAVNLQLLDGSRPELNNEKETKVKVESRVINCQGNHVTFILPVHGLAVMNNDVVTAR